MSPAIVLLAHGSPDPDWLAPVVAVADRLRARGRDVAVATLEHGPGLADSLDQLAARGHARVVVVPLFLSGGGRHVKRDIPALLDRLRSERPGLALELRGGALGADPLVLDALAAAALARAD